MMNDYVVIDIETTGLDPKRDKIIEIGAIKVIGNQVAEEYSTFVNPHRELKEAIVDLTGITDQDVEAAPDIQQVIPELVKFCENYSILGHHVIFDYSFLKRASVNCGLQFERTGVDTLKLCRIFMPAGSKKNLKYACSYFGIEQQRAHRALQDADVTHQLYQEIKTRFWMNQQELFAAAPLIYQVKKELPATKRQKEYLRDLAKYHKIDMDAEIAYLSRNEVSRVIDQIISQHGKMIKR